MKTYKNIQVIRKDIVSMTCDKCGKTDIVEKDYMDLQEWLHIHFVGGYDSVFGDGDEYECDFCQQCTKELVGQYLRYIGNNI
jgi:hypothetical protein